MKAEGFVLAGGRSTRFGSNKALAVVSGRTLLGIAMDAVRAAGLMPRVVCSDPERYRKLAVAFVLGERPGAGPTEGLRVALEASALPWSLVLGTDMPGVNGRLLRILLSAGSSVATPPPGVICFQHAGRRHPLPGLYHRSVLSSLGGSSLQSVLDASGVRLLGEGDAPGIDLQQALRNVNTQGDLSRP